ncbi:MAG: alpha/beta hydrolase [Chloroflexi bacterium]|nr:alpha/beta hydrolase [Chloroflexota bacterium]
MAIVSELLSIPMATTGRVDIYSGVQRLMGRIYGQLVRPDDRPSRTALLITHPASAFLGHYLLQPLAEAGIHALGLNTRYAANDSNLIMENVLLDIGSTVDALRQRGYERVVLVGNSGGGSVVAYYQAEAQANTVSTTVGGEPVDLSHLAPADGLILVAVHSSRARVVTEWLDPSVVDEADPFTVDAALDMYDERNGPPYAEDFLRRYRAAQIERNRRITRWCYDTIERLKADRSPVTNLGFVVHRTFAEPGFVDLAIEPSEREVCRLWGDPRAANLNAASLGRFSSLHAWLSQFSYADSRADALSQLPRVSSPILMLQGTADECVLPHHPHGMFGAIHHADKELVWIKGGTHYLFTQPDALAETVASISHWLASHGLD